jgi:predicted nucleic acid-binding protein
MPTKTREQSAVQDLERAEREVREVLERIKDGDRKVGPEDLERAERRARFAGARLSGEERRREEEAERARLGRLEELRERTLSELDPAPLEKRKEAAEKALDAYIAACVEHNGKLDRIAGELAGLEPLSEGLGVRHGSDGANLSLKGRDVRRVRPIVEVAGMARDALRAHLRGGYIDLERPY